MRICIRDGCLGLASFLQLTWFLVLVVLQLQSVVVNQLTALLAYEGKTAKIKI